MTQARILIVGAGAVGSFYGALLKRAGCSVDVVVRSDHATIAEHGFSIDSPLGDLSYRPDRVYADNETADDASAGYDYVICCVKVVERIDRPALIAPWLSANTQIVLIENGMNIEPAVADALPDHELISCLAFVGVSRTAPGVIRHQGFGRLTIGAWPAGNTTHCRALGALFEAGGIDIKQTESVVRERWAKSLWNTPFNPLSVIAGGADTLTMLDAPGGETLVRALMAEVMATAAADGYPLPENAIDRNIDNTRSMGAYRNSMALDFLAGRTMEMQAILGNVIDIAHAHAVAVPQLDALQALVHMQARTAASKANTDG